MTLPVGGECAYCGQREGHSRRCSVTKFGVKEMRVAGIHGPCACEARCGDVHQDEDDPSMPVCKGLPRMPAPPLVEIVMVRRDVD
jgi:hypothetical protein